MKVVEDSTQGKSKGEIKPGVVEVCYPCREGMSAEETKDDKVEVNLVTKGITIAEALEVRDILVYDGAACQIQSFMIGCIENDETELTKEGKSGKAELGSLYH